MNYYLNKLMTYHEVHRMARDGFSVSKIADYLGMNWRTAKRLLSLSEEEFDRELSKPKGRKKVLEIYTEFVRERLQIHPETSAAQMHDWLKEHHRDFPPGKPEDRFQFCTFGQDGLPYPENGIPTGICDGSGVILWSAGAG